ncbi:hypothetical protein SYNPS1DRAFT_12314, partial [Syncephalis pseudoplumigaleata]
EQKIWYKVEPVPHSLVINVGDMARVWSNGAYKAAMHRVVHRGERLRYSIPLFYEPRFDATMAPFPSFVAEQNGQSAAYEPVRFGDYVLRRLASFYSGKG